MRKACKIKQRDITDCGAACLASVAAYYRRDIPVSKWRVLSGTDKFGTTLHGMIEACDKTGFRAKAVKGTITHLPLLLLPVIAHVKYNESFHYVVIYKVRKTQVEIMDPAGGHAQKVSISAFEKLCTGIYLIIVPDDSIQVAHQRVSNLSRFLTLIKPERGVFFQIFTAAIFFILLGLAPSIYLQKIIDHVLSDGNLRLLNLLTVIMLVLLVMHAAFGYIKSFLALQLGQAIDARLILGYYRHLLQLPQRFFDTMRVGEIISRINDAVKIRVFMNSTGIDILLNSFILVFSFLVMFIYNIKLSLLILSFFPLFFIIYFLSSISNKKWQRKIMEAAAELETQLVESLNAATTIKRLRLESFNNERTEKRLITLLRSLMTANKTSLYSLGTSEFLSRLITVALLWTGSYFVVSNELTTGELLSFYSLIGYITLPAVSLINSTRNIHEASIAATRLFEIIDLETESSDEAKVNIKRETLGDIIFKDVHFQYNSRMVIYKGFNTTFEMGKMSAVVGDSGTGKSTLISLLQNLYPLQQGNILLGELDLKFITHSSLRQVIGVVPQEIHLFGLSIIENIAIGDPQPDIKSIINLCRLLGLAEFIEKLPDNYRTILNEQSTNLSGGQKQRLAIARALYRNPEILLLDEATSSLDQKNERNVLDTLAWFKRQGKTIIVIAHRLTTVKNCDIIKVLKDGRIIEEGPHEQLVQNNGIYKRMWEGHLSE